MISSLFSRFFSFKGLAGPKEFLEILVDRALLVSCQNIITLRATILGDDTNHTYFWEQIEGNSVEWLEDQNQPEVTYRKISSGDATFRFWVDKNTPFQQFRDLFVSGNARDEANISKVLRSSSKISTNTDLAVSAISLYPVFSQPGESNINNGDMLIYFLSPNTQYPVVSLGHYISAVENGQLTELGPIAPNSFYGPIQNNITYYIVSKYQVGINEFSSTSKPIFFNANISPVVDSTEVAAVQPQISSNSKISLAQRTSIELITLGGIDDEIVTLNSNIATTSRVSLAQRTSLELVNLNELQDSILINKSISSSSSINIAQILSSGGLITLG